MSNRRITCLSLLAIILAVNFGSFTVYGAEKDKQLQIPDIVCKRFQALFKKYYPKVIYTTPTINSIKFKYKIALFNFPSTSTGKRGSSKKQGPQKGGILCSIYLTQGPYRGQLKLMPRRNGHNMPYIRDFKVYKQQLIAAYSAKLDAHLWISLTYPEDVSSDFLKAFHKIITDFENDNNQTITQYEVGLPCTPLMNYLKKTQVNKLKLDISHKYILKQSKTLPVYPSLSPPGSTRKQYEAQIKAKHQIYITKMYDMLKAGKEAMAISFVKRKMNNLRNV